MEVRCLMERCHSLASSLCQLALRSRSVMGSSSLSSEVAGPMDWLRDKVPMAAKVAGVCVHDQSQTRD